MFHREVFDALATFYSQGDFADLYKQAREEYFALLGKFFEDDAFFETRINGFLEWYLIDRLYQPLGISLVRRHRVMLRKEISVDEQHALQAYEDSDHDIFIVDSIGEKDVELESVTQGATYEIRQNTQYVSLQPGDIIDARIIRAPDGYQITPSFFHYSKEALSLIENLWKTRSTVNLNKKDWLLTVAHMRWKREQFPHVPITQVFQYAKKK